MARLAYDLKLLRPGCVLLQAAMGGSVMLANRFPAESWLLTPTEDMKVYDNIPDEDIEKMIMFASKMAREGAYE
jgi:hypothetical protein